MKNIRKVGFTKFRLGAVSLASTLALLVSSLAPAFIAPVHAGTLSSTYIRENNMTAAGTSTLRLVFTPAGNPGVSGKVILTFPAGYTVSGTQATSVATCPAQTGATALPITSASGTGQAITIVLSGVLTPATPYCVDLTTAASVTNPATGNYVVAIATQTSGSSPVDSTSIGLDSITGADTVTVSATVPPSFTMALNATTDALGTINPGTVAISGGDTTTFTTNAAHGWFAWVEDTNAGLNSPTASHTIPTVSAGSTTNLNSAPSTEQYGLDAIITHTGTGDPGTLAISTGYNGGATSSKTAGGLSNSIFNTYATNTGTANGDIISFYEMATASGQTPAGNDYADVLTMLGAGSF